MQMGAALSFVRGSFRQAKSEAAEISPVKFF